MLQQTTIKAVRPKYLNFVQKFPDLFAVADAEIQDLKLAVSGLGYYRRFSYLQNAAKYLVKDEKTRKKNISYPNSSAEWRKLSGIGPYTANAIASICFEERVGVVDGNVERVVARILSSNFRLGSKFLKLHAQEFMNNLSAWGSASSLNQGVMELGQTICVTGVPRCASCPIQVFCKSFKTSRQLNFPVPKIRKTFQKIDVSLVIHLNSEGKIKLLERAASEKFLKGVLGFPTFYNDDILTKDYSSLTKVGQFKHSITQYKLNCQVYLQRNCTAVDGFWFDHDSVEKKLISNLDHKALKLLQKKEADQQRSASLYIIRAKRGEEGVKLDSRLLNINPRLISRENQARGASLYERF